ncbi:Hypothetical predicted protein [Cloeon dipterum]|uniref:Gustatory receptor n=1 Tax=Cloeon dipterum TaxID=197152 RepID=A0A8S1DL42_9INSE|nr:Hypothetical predicted protein [Cloeon dipterum]
MPSTMRKVLKILRLVDQTLATNSSNPRANFFIALALSALVFRYSLSLSVVNPAWFYYLIGARVVYCTNVFSELLVCLVCTELRVRLETLNGKIRTLQDHCKGEIKKLSDAFYAITKIQKDLAYSVRFFLLFDLSQLFMLILSGFLNTCLRCSNFSNGKMTMNWCVYTLGMAMDGTWRFSAIAASCGRLQSEAEKTAELVNRHVIHSQNYKRKQELRIFFEVASFRKASFSACGLFNVDLQFLFATAGAITGYIFLITQL